MSLFEIKKVDKEFYERELYDFLPDRLLTCIPTSTPKEHENRAQRPRGRLAFLVAPENTGADPGDL
jgi:hypothetical protein